MEVDTQSHRHLTRQMEIIDTDKLTMPVTIIGCGAIGSFLGLQLAKMGMTRITAYDHDVVSIENMSNQFFRFKDIGKNKAHALDHLIYDFTGVQITSVADKFGPDYVSTRSGIIVVAVDSMEARRMVYESIKEKNFDVKYIIDPRMSAEHFTMYVIDPHSTKDQESYEKTLHSDSEGVQERCTAKSTVYTASLGAGLVTKAVKNIIMRQPYPRVTLWSIAASSSPMNMYAANPWGADGSNKTEQ